MKTFFRVTIAVIILFFSLFYFFTKGRLTIVNNSSQHLTDVSYYLECQSTAEAVHTGAVSAGSEKTFMLPFMFTVPCDGTFFVNLKMQDKLSRVDCGVYMGHAERYTINVSDDLTALTCIDH